VVKYLEREVPPTTTEQETFKQLAEDQQLQSDSSRAAGRIARTYAEALLKVANTRNQADDVGEELQSLLRGLLDGHDGVEAFFADPTLSRERKDAVLTKVFGANASPLLADFLRVLNRKDRLGLVRLIAIAYRSLRDDAADRVRVLVEAAAPLTEAQQDEVAKTLAASLGKTPIVVVRLTPDLIGGMIVRVGDKVFDTSVRTKLQTLKHQLTARGTHAIQSGRDRFCS
jgi:F-type H+-transporting ATPase subunit delta